MDKLFQTLKDRFEQNMHRHPGVLWKDIEDKILYHKDILMTLEKMEATGGEPDVLSYQDGLYYVDFSKESPVGRRSLCFDEKAWHARKQNKPTSNVEKEASNMGVELVDEDMYVYMQSLEDLDLKTSSWIATPEAFRALGGALNAEKRYQRTFIFHNGADSYYAARGYRGYIKL